MKSLTLCLLVFTLYSFTDSYSQNTKLKIKLEQGTFIDLISEIESQSEFIFIYSDEVLPELKKTRGEITLKKASVTKILDKALSNSGLDYFINDRQIIIKKSIEVPTVQNAVVIIETENVPQKPEVKGTVSDETGPLPGVSILIEGTTAGTETDFDGNFTLNADKGEVLVFSFVGMITQKVTISDDLNIAVLLENDENSLDEVVVVGYGTMKKRDVTSAVAQVSSKDIEKRVVTRLDNALQGKMAGVSIQQSSGVPGAAPVIRIRGTNSITEGNQPLFVIDGMPVEDAVIIANLNMNDVASVEVLKDAASAAIYGSRGSNGVIIITTKKGKKGRARITYSTFYGTQEAEKRMDMLSGPEHAEYEIERREWLISQDPNYDLNTPNDDRPAKLRIDPNWYTGNVQTYDQQDLVFRSAPIQSHNISISGGDDNTTYLASMAYLDQEGIIKGTSFDRFSFRINLESQINKRIKVGLKLSPSFSTQNDNNSEGKDQTMTSMLLAPPTVDLTESYYNESTGFMVHDYMDYYGYSRNSARHFYRLNNLQQEYKRNQLLTNAFVDINIVDGLNFKTAIYYRQNNLKSNDYRDIYNGTGVRNSTIGNSFNTNWTFENTLNYVKEIGKHSIGGLVGYSSQKDFYENTVVRGEGFVNDKILTLGAASIIPSWSQNVQEWSMTSAFARATYSYNSRYMLTASIRRDGSSRFGDNNKYGVFPAVSMGWRISDEGFMSSLTAVNNLKFRASFGVTGNNRIGNYRPLASLYTSNAILGREETTTIGLIPGSLENQDLSWEKNQTVNLGLDVGILENRVTLALDVYKSITKDLLLNVPVPHTTGYYAAIQNVGEVQNKGFEMEISSRNISTSDFSWNTSFVFSYNKNEVLKMGPDGSAIKNGDFWCRDCSYTGVGYPIGSFNLYETDGVFMSQAEVDASALYSDEGVGDVKWVDQNGDGVVNADDRMPLGNPTPTTNFGLTNTFRYKRLDLNLFINGASGHETFLAVSRYISRPQVAVNLKEYTNRWKSVSEPGNGTIPRVTSNAATNGRDEEHDRWLYDSDWWRIKNLTLGYSFLASSLEKINISSLRLYVSADNLFLNTDYPGYNPEGGLKPAPSQGTSQSESVYNPRFSQNQSPSFNLGMDFGSTPQVKRFIFGLNVTF